MQKIFSTIEIVANTDAPVFVTGETGTGKELVARAVHELSRRFHHPFIALNCAALPKDMIESELFGHEKGAFTGAVSERHGAFEAAHQGTLFLDEIGELSPDLQAKLLRVIESGEVKRLGSNKIIKVSVRIVTATHRNLVEDVVQGRFRQDLLYRLHVAPIHLPPLRERREDLEVLIPHLIKKLQVEAVLSNEAFRSLRYCDFGGNIRELKNVLQRAVIEYEVQGGKLQLGKPRVLEIKHFQFIKGIPTCRGPRNEDEQSEYEQIIRLLDETNGNQSEAAKKMNMAMSTFNDRVRKYGLNLKSRSF
jgi:transcriptional regulator with GAF, ATPase, and Fis domain